METQIEGSKDIYNRYLSFNEASIEFENKRETMVSEESSEKANELFFEYNKISKMLYSKKRKIDAAHARIKLSGDHDLAREAENMLDALEKYEFAQNDIMIKKFYDSELAEEQEDDVDGESSKDVDMTSSANKTPPTYHI